MNELLGWYGLPSMDKMDAGSLPGVTSLTYSSPPQNGIPSPGSLSNTYNFHSDVKTCRPTHRTHSDEGDSAGTKSEEKEDREINPSIDFAPKISSNCIINSKAENSGTGTIKIIINDSNNNSNRSNNNGNCREEIVQSITALGKNIHTTKDDVDNIIDLGPVNHKKQSRHFCYADNNEVEERRKHYNDNEKGSGADENNDGVDVDKTDEGVITSCNRESVSVSSDTSVGELSPLTSLNTAVPENERSVVIMCTWCQKEGNKLFTLEMSKGTKAFCSELCFTQCRRASFKKNKVCDWCKHVRHTVNFVDFQDGDTQLQFCSEKCLNQYKMNIFCNEAREHLRHFQGLDGTLDKKNNREPKNDRRSQNDILITPELWMAGNDGLAQGLSDDVVKNECEDDNSQELRLGKENSRNGALNYDRKKNLAEIECDDVEDDDGNDDDGGEPGELKQRIRMPIDISEAEENALILTDNRLDSRSNKGSGKNSHHGHLPKTKADNFNSGKKGREIDRYQKMLAESDNGLLNNFNMAINNKTISSSISSKKGKKSNIEQGKSTETPVNSFKANFADDTNNTLLTSKSPDSLLSPWNPSRLLAMMPNQIPPNTTGAAASPVAGLEQCLNDMGYPSNSLLYSSLFRLPQVNPSASTSSSTNTNSGDIHNAAQRRSRHESRRELLRDRDFSRESEKSLHERENLETHSVPISPSTSHSSSGTPGPVPAQLPGTNILSRHGILPGYTRYFHHPLLMTNGPQAGAPSSLFADPSNTAAFLQLHLALQQTSGQNQPLNDIPLLQSLHPAPTHPPSPPPSTSQSKSSNSAQTSGIGSMHLNYPDVASSSKQHQNPHPVPQQQPPLRPLRSTLSFTDEATETHSLSSLLHPATGVPPVTILVPYPVVMPIPLPIPFPIPISPEKLDAFFKTKKSEQNKPSTSGSRPQWNLDNGEPVRSSSSGSGRSQLANHSNPFVKLSPASSPSPLQRTTPNLDLPGSSYTSSASHEITHPPLSISRESADSIMTLRREITCPYKNSPTSSSPSLKRSFSPKMHMYDLSKNAKRSFSASSNDEEAMDLSKFSSRSVSPKHTADTAEKEDNAIGSHFAAAVDSVSPENLIVPKIHIVSDKSAPPLCTPLTTSQVQSPLDQSSYSSRRSRILDAPCVPKATRRASPERRYVRNVPKDMVEAAKRRGLRARVRTK